MLGFSEGNSQGLLHLCGPSGSAAGVFFGLGLFGV